jgi:two-component system sensor histidine kinase FlrB
MHLSSHFEPRIELDAIAPSGIAQPELMHLTDAFSEFISASARLEGSYASLQLEVTRLSDQLAERNAALEASLAENQRIHRALQRIVESMPCGVLVVEANGTVSTLNPEARRLLLLDNLHGRRLDAISADLGIDLAGFLKHSGAEGEQEFCLDAPAPRRWLSVTRRRLFSAAEMEGSSRQQTILILRDVTAHKQMEAEREQARRAITLSEVTATLAHEIRNPLTSLELFAGLIGQGDGNGEYVSHLRAGIRSLSATVNNVLSFHGAAYPALTSLDLGETIRSSVEFARPIAAEAGVNLRFTAPARRIRVQGNSSALQQVVLNLICNAVRHSQPEGSIDVSIRTTSLHNKTANRKAAVICFQDTGSGIAAADLPEIFRAGFSGSGNTSGFGLAVSRQIVEQHGGSIRVESRLAQGTTFFVEIPAL